MKKMICFTFIFWVTALTTVGIASGNGFDVTSDLWIRAVINTDEKGPIEAVWKKGGESLTAAGDRVIWGYFYASHDDVSWGSRENPDLFVKIWFDRSGRVDVNFFHVSVPSIDVYSDYPYNGIIDEHGTATLSRRYIRHYYYEDRQSGMDVTYEDGNPPEGYSPAGNPAGYSPDRDLSVGAVINTEEKGPIEAIWRKGGEDTTEERHRVIWGYFYASNDDVNWGSENNPDLFVKIWFDATGRVDVNFFHVSVPDIEIFSQLSDKGNQQGTTILNNRYIRHEYMLDFDLREFIVTGQIPADNCEIPESENSFTDTDDFIRVWALYRTYETGKSYRIEWYNPDGVSVLTQSDTIISDGWRCLWKPISRSELRQGGSGTWTVRFFYDNREYAKETYVFVSDPEANFEITRFLFTSKKPSEGCEEPDYETVFGNDVTGVFAWVDYRNFEPGKSYKFEWYNPEGTLAQINTGPLKEFSDGCSYAKIEGDILRKYPSGEWEVRFYYDGEVYQSEYFYQG